MDIYFVRHTPVDNPGKLCYGQADMDLSADFDDHFTAVSKHLGPTEDAMIISSPSKRCTLLAEYLSGEDFETDDRLAEMNFGLWERLPWANINPHELDLWMSDFVNYRIPGGESFKQMHQRCTEFWYELRVKQYKRAIIVTHTGVIRSVLANVLGIPLPKVFQLQVGYGSVTKLHINAQQDFYTTVHYINQ